MVPPTSMENDYNEMVAALDDIQYRRAERSLPKKQLAKLCLETLSRVRKAHEKLINRAVTALHNVKTTLDDDYEDYGDNPPKKHGEFNESFSCESDTCRVEAEFNLYNPAGSNWLTLSFIDKRLGSKRSINSLQPDMFDNPGTAAKLADCLIDNGHGTESTVNAIETAASGVFGKLESYLTSLDEIIDKAAGRKLEGTIPQKCKVLRSMGRDAITERTERLTPLCMKALEPLKGKLQYLGETVLLVSKAEETFGKMEEKVFRHSFEDDSLYWQVFDENMLVEILVQKHYDSENTRLLVHIDGSYEDDNWWSEPKDFERTFIKVLSTRTIGSRQAENLPKALEDAVAKIQRAAAEARKIIKEKIESELK